MYYPEMVGVKIRGIDSLYSFHVTFKPIKIPFCVKFAGALSSTSKINVFKKSKIKKIFVVGILWNDTF